MQCVKCGTVFDDGCKFCPECGTPQRQGICPNCQAQIVPGASFCSNCGSQLVARQRNAVQQHITESVCQPQYQPPQPTIIINNTNTNVNANRPDSVSRVDGMTSEKSRWLAFPVSGVRRHGHPPVLCGQSGHRHFVAADLWAIRHRMVH